jgi:hypothetical protein
LKEFLIQLEELLKKGYIRQVVFGVQCEEEGWFAEKSVPTSSNLNKVKMKNKYRLPRIDDMFDHIRDAMIFSKTRSHIWISLSDN